MLNRPARSTERCRQSARRPRADETCALDRQHRPAVETRSRRRAPPKRCSPATPRLSTVYWASTMRRKQAVPPTRRSNCSFLSVSRDAFRRNLGPNDDAKHDRHPQPEAGRAVVQSFVSADDLAGYCATATHTCPDTAAADRYAKLPETLNRTCPVLRAVRTVEIVALRTIRPRNIGFGIGDVVSLRVFGRAFDIDELFHIEIVLECHLASIGKNNINRQLWRSVYIDELCCCSSGIEIARHAQDQAAIPIVFQMCRNPILNCTRIDCIPGRNKSGRLAGFRNVRTPAHRQNPAPPVCVVKILQVQKCRDIGSFCRNLHGAVDELTVVPWLARHLKFSQGANAQIMYVALPHTLANRRRFDSLFAAR